MHLWDVGKQGKALIVELGKELVEERRLVGFDAAASWVVHPIEVRVDSQEQEKQPRNPWGLEKTVAQVAQVEVEQPWGERGNRLRQKPGAQWHWVGVGSGLKQP